MSLSDKQSTPARPASHAGAAAAGAKPATQDAVPAASAGQSGAVSHDTQQDQRKDTRSDEQASKQQGKQQGRPQGKQQEKQQDRQRGNRQDKQQDKQQEKHRDRHGIAVLSEARGFGALTAAAWADAIIAFWEIARCQPGYDAQAPLDILDLAPGRGATVWMLLQALQRRIARLPDFQPRWRYLATAPQRQLLLPLRSQQELKPLLDHGTLVPVLWDPERGDPCLLAAEGRQSWRPVNPVVVLAHDRWGTLAQRLLAVHYGALLEADLMRLRRPPRNNQPEQKLWLPLGQPPLPATLEEMVRRYRAEFNSAPLPLPVGALGAIERIAALAPRGYLVLAVAPGATSERKLRLCHFGPLLDDYARSARAPVNFHLLEQRYRELGAAVWQRDLYGDMATQLALGNLAGADHHLARITAPMNRGSLGATAALVEAMAALRCRPGKIPGTAELDVMLSLLRQSESDPQVFLAAGDRLVNGLHAHADCNRDGWSEALAQVWEHYLPSADPPVLHRQLAAAAMQVADWGLARRVLRRGLVTHGKNATDLAHLAWVAARTGGLRDGQALVARALALEASSTVAREVAARIGARLASRDEEWNTSLGAAGSPLTVEPLDLSHAEALLHQYRDPQIGVMTGLQALQTLDETRKWIADHVEEAGRRGYAIMHADHGFVGYICLHVSLDTAYFCFWIGVDFQGRRHAAEASRLVLELARRRGIAMMFTSAYDDNVRSIRALERIGFLPMALRALAPESDRLFLSMRLRPLHSGEADDPPGALVDYYRREKLAISFAGYPPFVPEPVADATAPAENQTLEAAMGLQLQPEGVQHESALTQLPQPD